MRLNSTLIERTASQCQARAIPDSDPMMPKLNQLFGDHTFFLSGSGLHIVEPAGRTAKEGQVLKIASWTDTERNALVPHQAEPTDVVIPLDSPSGNAT